MKKLAAIFAALYGLNATLSRAEASQYRAYLRGVANKIMLENPDFYFMYFDVFRVEVEEEVTYYGGDI